DSARRNPAHVDYPGIHRRQQFQLLIPRPAAGMGKAQSIATQQPLRALAPGYGRRVPRQGRAAGTRRESCRRPGKENICRTRLRSSKKNYFCIANAHPYTTHGNN
ncbi:hypothetical protein, partial [uncultured Alistipes sp.]|uniref:hypothetical protein n=1 Tax=uncultured Alistipes sp. TaxID=538949 RepID=UPI0025FF9639